MQAAAKTDLIVNGDPHLSVDEVRQSSVASLQPGSAGDY